MKNGMTGRDDASWQDGFAQYYTKREIFLESIDIQARWRKEMEDASK